MAIKRLFFLLCLGAIGAVIVRATLIEGIYLKTDSMAPTLPQGTHVFVNKMPFLFRSPHRGEIVMFYTPQLNDPKKDLVKRVIAVAGDTIEIRKKKVVLNGQPLDEPYIQNLRPEEILQGDNRPPIVVPDGFVFVMGDNRDYSADSRDWNDASGNWSPYVSVQSIKGLVLASN